MVDKRVVHSAGRWAARWADWKAVLRADPKVATRDVQMVASWAAKTVAKMGGSSGAMKADHLAAYSVGQTV